MHLSAGLVIPFLFASLSSGLRLNKRCGTRGECDALNVDVFDEEDDPLDAKLVSVISNFSQSSLLKMDSSLPIVRVMGLQRSGTNLWETMVNKCSLPHGRCVPSSSDGKAVQCVGGCSRKRFQPCWKHFRVNENHFTPQNSTTDYKSSVESIHVLDRMTGVAKERSLPTYFVTIKSPFAWIRSDCMFHSNEDCTNDGVLQAKLLEWHAYVGKWMELQRQLPRRVVILPYEQLLKEPSSSIKHVVKSLGVARSPSGRCLKQSLHTLVNPAAEAEAEEVSMSPGDTWKESRSFYLDCKYVGFFSYAQHRLLNKLVNASVVHALGYHVDSLGCARLT